MDDIKKRRALPDKPARGGWARKSLKYRGWWM
jgi:hypothetical protein